MKNKAYLFLKRHNATIDCVNDEKFIRNFTNEMKKGLKSKSSLKMAPTFIKKDLKLSHRYTKCLVLDAGGTNLRGAVANFKNNEIYFSKIKQQKLPIVNDKDKFYQALANFIKSITKEHLPIGFCFSFLCKMNNKLDGKIIDFGKTIKMKKVLNTYVADELRKKLNYPVTIKIINDTIAANLGIQLRKNKNANYLSYILGTGTNISYYEGNDLINVESAGFDKFLLSDFEKLLIKRTGAVDVFEKTCGGQYLGSVFNYALNQAHQEKVIRLKKKLNLSLGEYSKLSKNLFCDQDSYLTSQLIIKEMTLRISKMNALMLVSIIKQFKNKQISYIALEGTTLKKLPGFKENLKKNVLRYIHSSNIKFVIDDNLNLKGAALVTLV